MAWLGAVAMLLAGIRLLGSGLAGWTGAVARAWLARRRQRPWTALLAGLAATVALQSSSATTLLVLSAADAGWLDDRAALLAVIGANVGTAASSQLLAHPWQGAVPLLYGLAALSLLARPRPAAPSLALLGAALLLDGLARLDALAAPLADDPGVRALVLCSADRPGAALVAGFAVTTAIDSSSAAVALLQRLADRGLMGLEQAFRFLLGSEVGTTTGTLLASLALGPPARRAALGHLLFNLFTVVLLAPLAEPLASALDALSPHPARAIAHAHLLANAVPALLVLPVHARLAAWLGRRVR